MTLTSLIWAGHALIARLAAGQIGPMTLTCARWGLALAPILYAARSELRRDLPRLNGRWRYAIAMGAFGFTGFNALFYVAAHRTTAVNLSILQGVIPAIVLAGARFALKTSISRLQWVGAFITFAGVVAIACQGDLSRLATLTFNGGDVLMVAAVTIYSVYTLGLARRPDVSPFCFLAILAVVAFLTSLPLMVLEIGLGGFIWPTPLGLATLVYAALGPAFLSQAFYLRGVALIGPSRAGVFVNLVPIFGALMGVALLSEPFYAYHVIALTLVAGGVALAQYAPGRKKARSEFGKDQEETRWAG